MSVTGKRKIGYNKIDVIACVITSIKEDIDSKMSSFIIWEEEQFMQKTFIKYTFFIMTSAILLILFINFIFMFHSLESQQFNTFQTKIEQVIHTLENNQTELTLLKESLDEDYLTRAKAAAYVLDRQQEVSMNVSEMQYLAKLLNVDELHVIDENGIIVFASVPKYVGINMNDHEQTRAFLDLLESGDEDAYLIQDAQPNAAEGKVMQYVGVVRKSQKGVVQVGFEPKRQLEAQSRNTYEYIFSKFPTDVGEELFAVDGTTKEIIGHSNGIQQNFAADCYQLNQLEDCTKGSYQRGKDGKFMYVVSRKYENVMICAALPGEIMLSKLIKSAVSTLFYLLFIEAAVIALLNYLVKKKVINGIHNIIQKLSLITEGNLDTKVEVGGNKEFEELSDGINTMVKSIVNISDRISAIIEMSGIPLAAFEYNKESKHVFVTTGLMELLGISNDKAIELYSNSYLFDVYIREIMKKPAEGEKDIYQINDSKYIRIHMSVYSDGYLGVITDATKNMMEKKQMQYENTHDDLTGLYKYPYFKQLASEKLKKVSSSQKCAIVMLDLDYFKSINDTFGHDAGDKYLQSFSSVMKSMPQEHFLTARRSGDEFCMMIFDCADREDIITFMDEFYNILNQNSVKLSETEFRTISASGGFAWTEDSNISVYELLSQADEALYEVKKSTKGIYAEYAAE